MTTSNVFYADHNATTPCDPSVIRAMVECLAEDFGNPNSTHVYGRCALQRLEWARDQIAACVDCDREDIVFTSGATEAINLFVKGLADERGLSFLLSDIEHSSVMEAIRRRTFSLGEARQLSLLPGGKIDSDVLRTECGAGVDVAVLQAVNSETGVVQNVRTLVQTARSQGAITFVDAAQALWKLPVSFREWGCDAMVLSAHKAYGPKGAGALIARKPIRRAIARLIDGGGPDQSLRAGTENVPAMVGFGLCCLQVSEFSENWRRSVCAARNLFESTVLELIGSQVISQFEMHERAPNTSSLTFRGIGADVMLAQMYDIAASYGAACSSGSLEPSMTLLASGMSREDASSTIRFSFGPDFDEGLAIEVANRVWSAYKRSSAALQ